MDEGALNWWIKTDASHQPHIKISRHEVIMEFWFIMRAISGCILISQVGYLMHKVIRQLLH